MTDTQRDAVRDAMTPFAGKRAFVLINGATKELVEFGTKLNAALVAAGVNSEVNTGIAFPVGAAPQLALFVGFKSGTANMAQTLINAVVKNRILPGSEIGYHQYGDESQDAIQIIVSRLN